MRLLPRILATLTGKPRYLPDISWSKNSWVHNIFRVYELVFWRKVGIRAESSYNSDGTVELYTFEAWCAFFETCIRRTLKFKPVKLHQFRLATNPYGYAIPMASFAIALDAAGNFGTTTGSATSPITWSQTCTGSNLILVLGSGVCTSSATIANTTAVTYNSVSLTKARADQNTSSFAVESSIWMKGAPSTGANTVSVTFGGAGSITPTCYAGAVSYSGAQSSSTADAVNGTNGTTTGAKTASVTTVADNCWIFCAITASGSTGSVTATQTSRFSSGLVNQAHIGGEDTNAAKSPAGAYSVGYTINTITNSFGMSGASFAPAAGATFIALPFKPIQQAVNRASTY